MPDLYFFRHERGIAGCRAGSQFGGKYFWKWWRKACENLGIEEVPLYPGTRHSSVRALRKKFSPEQIKSGTMHATNKAFERYYSVGADDIREIYALSKPKSKQSVVIDFKKKSEQ